MDGNCAQEVGDPRLGALKSNSCNFNEHFEEKNYVCSFFINFITLVYFLVVDAEKEDHGMDYQIQ